MSQKRLIVKAPFLHNIKRTTGLTWSISFYQSPYHHPRWGLFEGGLLRGGNLRMYGISFLLSRDSNLKSITTDLVSFYTHQQIIHKNSYLLRSIIEFLAGDIRS